MTTFAWRWFLNLFNYDLWQSYANPWLIYLFWISMPSNFLWGILVLLNPVVYILGEVFVQFAYEPLEPYMWQ